MNERIRNGEFVTFAGKKIKFKAKVVCGNCNNRWMSELEDKHVKPAMQNLLFGNALATLDPIKLAAISAYAFKTTVVANHKDLRTTPFFTSSDRFRFRRTLVIPDGVQVWIACRKSIHYTGAWTSSFGKFNRETRDTFSYYVCTWNFMNVVLQLVAGKWDNKLRRNTVNFPGIPQDDFWREASIPIWPLNNRVIEWPPPKFIGDNTFNAFSDRWKTIDPSTVARVFSHRSLSAKK